MRLGWVRWERETVGERDLEDEIERDEIGPSRSR